MALGRGTLTYRPGQTRGETFDDRGAATPKILPDQRARLHRIEPKMRKSQALEIGDDETLDSFYRGRVLVSPEKEAATASPSTPRCWPISSGPGRSDELLELGAGQRDHLPSPQPQAVPAGSSASRSSRSLADLARRNVGLNGLEDRIDRPAGGPPDLPAGREVRRRLLQPAVYPEEGGFPEPSPRKNPLQNTR